jgi:tRNA/tmRNA/rRNA uracil-C5-methylase (TrmA/RlmC/RlmD family)
MAKQVGRVVGIDIIASAIEDAKINADLNQINNAVYVCGKAEDVLNKALDDHAQTDDLVAIVDPPRGGLHPDVIRTLRKCERLKRVVYVSCNPKSLKDNLARFVQPPSKRYSGTPFIAMKAIPVDMFPHTDHCEMIMLLER